MMHFPEYGTPDFQRLLHVSQSTAKGFASTGIGMLGWLPGGDEELGIRTAELLQVHRAVLWDRHGCIAAGPDPFAAFDIIDLLEKAAEMFLMCRSAGHEPKWLTADELKPLGL
jgi:rhamnulose-1-phosphate aldolase